jgi:hypothetical protein
VRFGNGDELFFVTLVKDEKRFSPTTRYLDYAISPTLFHWQSQSGTTEDGEVGKRYCSAHTNRSGCEIGREWYFAEYREVRAHEEAVVLRAITSEGVKEQRPRTEILSGAESQPKRYQFRAPSK